MMEQGHSPSFPVMSPRAKFAVTTILLVLLGGLGAADYYFADEEYLAQLSQDTESGNTIFLDTTTGATVPLPPGQGVKKNQGPAVETIATQLGMSVSENAELTMLAQVAGDAPGVQSYSLVQNGDRIGSVTWVESPDVKTIFITLKEALLPAFSPKLTGLRDETLQETGKPVRNLLTFFDPALSEEQLVFVRVRERLFEFHIATDKEEAMQSFIDAQTGQ